MGEKSPFPVLLAEDSAVSRKILEMTLLRAGYEVTSVGNGIEALDLFKSQFFPIIVTDWMMPEMDGIELCKEIRKDACRDYVFIVLLTAKDSKKDIVRGLEAGADDYLTKPPDHDELIARIKTGVRILELEKSLKKANEEIRILSITDHLTGIYNRIYLSEHLPKEIKRSRRYKHPLAVVLCDIDHFKKINDTYGHRTGDQVLKEFVQCIKDSIRKDVDWVVRYGGEEFLIILPETDVQGAKSMAERLRYNVTQMVVEAEEAKIRLTASFGIAGIELKKSQKILPESIVNLADKYLYQAKQEGRNRVVAG